MEITQDLLRERLVYDEITGELTYRYSVSGRAQKGHRAGHSTKIGYILLKVAGTQIYAHRAIWIYMTGSNPETNIDHIDGVRANNRWSNLRLATVRQNNLNKPGRSSSGVKGVYFVPKTGRWVAELRIFRKRVYQEYFGTLDQAEEGIRINRIRIHGEFANHENKIPRGHDQ